MTWTYTDPSASDKDAVRFLVGDTDTTDQQVTDEEIAYALAAEGSVNQAAASIARSIAAKYARKVDKSVGDLKYSYSQRQKAYLDMADRLEKDAAISGASPYAGGISRSDKETVRDDDDRVAPRIRRGQMDNPGTLTEEDLADICDD